jgi:DNA-binding CsgD family transcriptional regulator
MSAESVTNEQPAYLKWSGGSLPLTGPCVIGRRSDNDISINNVQVSRRHALLMNHNSVWWLNDLGSRNGIYLNGLRITSARRLRDGDEIRIANDRITFKNGQQGLLLRSTIVGSTTQLAQPEENDASYSPVVSELLISSLQGEILEGEKAAQWFFGKKLERSPGAERFCLPPQVREWLTRIMETSAAFAPLEIQEGEKKLVVSLARCKDERCFLLLREESAQVSIERLQTLGLTEREAEVMHWVCEGKQNPEIAGILYVTLHTVKRHIEHILKKLGVESRQKAIKAVTDRLGA